MLAVRTGLLGRPIVSHSLVAQLSTSRAALGSEKTVKLWIDGQPVESKTNEWIDLTNPVRDSS